MPPKKKSTTTRARAAKSREQVAQEFEETAADVRAREPLTPNQRAANDAHRSQVRTAVEGLSTDMAVEKVTRVNLDISRALQGVQEQLSTAVNELTTVRTAIADAQQELEDIHGKDRALSALDVLVAEHEETQARFQKEEAEERQRLDGITADFNRRQKELELETAKNRQREEADFKYATELKRKGEQDAWAERLRLNQIEERDRREGLQKEWNARSEALKVQETEVAVLRQQLVELPVKLEAEHKKQLGAATGAIKQAADHAAALAQKDADSAKQLAENTISTLRAQNESLKNDVNQMATRLATADTKVSEIAQKALEAASGRQALNEITAFARDNNGSSTGTRSKS